MTLQTKLCEHGTSESDGLSFGAEPVVINDCSTGLSFIHFQMSHP